MSNSKVLPYVDIQPDALAVLDDVKQGIVIKEDIWVSAYEKGSESVHGKVGVETRGGGDVEITPRDGVQFERVSNSNFVVSVASLGIVRLPVRFPRQVISPPFTKPTPVSQELQINSIAYSDKSEQLVVGGPDGYAVVLSPSDPASALELKGHVGDVLGVKWFPSGEVVLTASSDLTLRIFSSKTGVNPRTLKGHTQSITATEIVGVGRQVLSASKDGSVRLWDVGQGEQAKKWTLPGGKSVDAMILVEDLSGLNTLGVIEDDEKVILAASSDGTIAAFALLSDSGSVPMLTTEAITSSKLLSIAYSPTSGLLATGHADGTIVVCSLASLVANDAANGVPTLLKRNDAPIYSLAFVEDQGTGLLVGTGAGLPCRLALHIKDIEFTVTVKEEYAGWEAVGIETWAVASDGVWCAGGDNRIRRY